MEPTVKISAKDYETLKGYERAFKDKEWIYIPSDRSYGGGDGFVRTLTETELVKELISLNKKIRRERDELRKMINNSSPIKTVKIRLW